MVWAGTAHAEAQSCPFIECPSQALACHCEGETQWVNYGATGELDRRDRVTYNPGASQHVIETDLHANGSIDMVERRSYADGSLEGIATEHMNARGLVTTAVLMDGMGVVVRRETWEYNSLGMRVGAERFSYENGLMVLHEVDNGADGNVDYRRTQSYDGSGFLAGHDDDFDADGNVDERRTYYTNDSGFVTRYEEDYEADGSVDLIRTYEYHEWDAIVSHTDDHGADGNPNVRCTYRPPCGAGADPSLCRTLNITNIECEPLGSD